MPRVAWPIEENAAAGQVRLLVRRLTGRTCVDFNFFNLVHPIFTVAQQGYNHDHDTADYRQPIAATKRIGNQPTACYAQYVDDDVALFTCRCWHCSPML
jgi:hypothetical protein